LARLNFSQSLSLQKPGQSRGFQAKPEPAHHYSSDSSSEFGSSPDTPPLSYSPSKSAYGGDRTIQITPYEDGVSCHTLAPWLELSDPRFALVRTASPASFYGPTKSDINTPDMHLASRFGMRGRGGSPWCRCGRRQSSCVNVRIGVRCGQRSWGLRGPDRSFATFRAGVVCDLGGVGGCAEQLSLSLVMLLARPGVVIFV